ncbi:MAG: hypothetical protein ABFR63_12405 [Thermodesulfobacteriota bacterium]
MKKEMIGVLGGCLLLGLAGSASAGDVLTFDGDQMYGVDGAGTFVKDANYVNLNSLDEVRYDGKNEVQISGKLGGDWTFSDKTTDYSHLALFVTKGPQCISQGKLVEYIKYNEDGTPVVIDGNNVRTDECDNAEAPLKLGDFEGYSLNFHNRSDQPIMVALGVGYGCPTGNFPQPDTTMTVIAPGENGRLSYSLWDSLTCGDVYKNVDPVIVGLGYVLMQMNVEEKKKDQVEWNRDYQLIVSSAE